jgi:ABC-type lipoprotein export system ATPase subunit
VIRLRKIIKRYGTNQVLRGVDLDIKDGEFVSIMGASGSGKSTLLNVIGALDTDWEGEASVAGSDLRKLSDRAVSSFRNTTIGFVFQSFHLLPHFTCGQNVALPAYFVRRKEPTAAGASTPGPALNRNMSEADIGKKVAECLERVGLLHKRDELPLHLSGGERQRIAIARALFNSPRIMLCDEPTGALDSKTGAQIMSLFEQLNRATGVTLIIVTHSPEVSALADRVITIVDGVIASDTMNRPAPA